MDDRPFFPRAARPPLSWAHPPRARSRLARLIAAMDDSIAGDVIGLAALIVIGCVAPLILIGLFG